MSLHEEYEKDANGQWVRKIGEKVGTVVKQWAGWGSENNNAYGGHGGYTLCDHWRDKVKVGKFTVLASGHRGLTKKGGGLLTGTIPDAGIYLYSGWANTLSPFMGCGMATPSKWSWPFIVAHWPDMGIMDEVDQGRLLKVTEGLIKKGEMVEIGCMGGHGRTGTLLAMLKVRLGGMGANAAMLAVRDEYCEKTVESNSQIDAIYEVAGEPVPKHKRPKATKGYTYQRGTSIAYKMGSDLWCEKDKGGCGHSRYMHTKVIERDREDGVCNMGGTGVNECGCEEFIWKDGDKEEWEERNKDSGDSGDKARQVEQGKLQPVSSSDEGESPELYPKEGGRSLSDIARDVCYCSHTRGTHVAELRGPVLEHFCTGCECDNFVRNVKVTTVSPVGIVER